MEIVKIPLKTTKLANVILLYSWSNSGEKVTQRHFRVKKNTQKKETNSLRKKNWSELIKTMYLQVFKSSYHFIFLTPWSNFNLLILLSILHDIATDAIIFN